MSASASSFGGKIASGIGGSLIGWILAAANYDPNVAEVTTSVRYGIYTFSIYLPLAMLVVMFLLVYRFDIEAKYPEIMKVVNERKAARSEE
jgi:GPH family glycoside/pentoside/hexuronide:cation symporter